MKKTKTEENSPGTVAGMHRQVTNPLDYREPEITAYKRTHTWSWCHGSATPNNLWLLPPRGCPRTSFCRCCRPIGVPNAGSRQVLAERSQPVNRGTFRFGHTKENCKRDVEKAQTRTWGQANFYRFQNIRGCREPYTDSDSIKFLNF